MKKQFNRRQFIKSVAATGIGLTISDNILSAVQPDFQSSPFRPIPIGKPMEKVRIGFTKNSQSPRASQA